MRSCLSLNPSLSPLPYVITRNLSSTSPWRSQHLPVCSTSRVKVTPGNFFEHAASAAEEGSTMKLGNKPFEQQLPVMLENIRRSMFVAVDLEFSGISWTGSKSKLPTVQERYADMKKTVETYQILQLGICPVEWDQQNGCYIARPTNIYLNPIVPNKEFGVSRNITLQGDAVDFLLKNGFDFNALFENGIPYLSHAEEKSVISRRQILLNRMEAEKIQLDDRNLAFVSQCMKAFKSWVEDIDSPFDFLTIGTESGALNSYQRRLVHQVIHLHFPGLHAVKKGGFMQVTKLSPQEQEAERKNKDKEFEEQIASSIGVRHIIDELFNPKASDGKKVVVVGHNLMIDLLFIYQTFIGPLPYSAVEFASVIHEAFPMVIDTKYLATLTDRNGGSSSTLSGVWQMLKDQRNPQIKLHADYMEYENAIANHEAGYDAYNSARILIKLAARMSSFYLNSGSAETAWASPNQGLTNFITAITQSGNFEDDVYFIPDFHDKGSHSATTFWNVLSNKLRAFGTVEGLYMLKPNP